jgi:GDP-mannose 6-dehydrogenase
MRIAVFGLGYVGCVSLGCLAEYGHSVIGVDINEFKVNQINAGKPTIIESGIDELIKKHTASGRIKATTDHSSAISGSDVAFICVGTPSAPTGQLDLSHIFNSARQIAEALREKSSFYTIVIRSTVLPGTNNRIAELIREITGGIRNVDFSVVSNPEFLREGSAVNDFFNPPYTVIGTDNDHSFGIMHEIYRPTGKPVIQTDYGVAEMIKYVNNSFHALKITFANEVGVIARQLGIDSVKLMELFVKDEKLNISPAYLKPGMAYGGSCLPKDLKGLYTVAHDNYLNTPLLRSISESNTVHLNRAFDLVEKYGSKRVGVIGLAFKKGTDDLRHSPAVELVEKLSGKGYNVSIFDRNVVLSKLVGANKSYVEEKLPHVSAMLVDSIETVIEHGETIVLVHHLDEVSEMKNLLEHKNIVDLTGYNDLKSLSTYLGIAW